MPATTNPAHQDHLRSPGSAHRAIRGFGSELMVCCRFAAWRAGLVACAPAIGGAAGRDRGGIRQGAGARRLAAAGRAPGLPALPGEGSREGSLVKSRPGGGRGRGRRRAGAWSWLSPLPGSYSRVGTAGRLCAGRCPSLTARAGPLIAETGIISCRGVVSRHAASSGVSWSSPPTRTRRARGRPPPRRRRPACRGRASSCTWRAAAAVPSRSGPVSPAAGRLAGV
jgi:hypothetical protein